MYVPVFNGLQDQLCFHLKYTIYRVESEKHKFTQNDTVTSEIDWWFVCLFVCRNCGEMAHTTDDYSSAGVCGTGSQIVYAWAMDAPSLTLPKGISTCNYSKFKKV